MTPHSVGQVVQAVRAGLLKHFPRERSVIINADGGSRDSTQDMVRAAAISDLSVASDVHALRTLHSISTQYEGGPANGIAMHTILAATDLLQAPRLRHCLSGIHHARTRLDGTFAQAGIA